MKNLVRLFATLLVAFGLIAGSLGSALAGMDVDDGGIDTDGGSGADGGDASTGGGNNSSGIEQGSEQEQGQTGEGQGQGVGQGNTQNLTQDSALSGEVDADIDVDCSATQQDGGDDDTATGAVASSLDDLICAVGAASVGASETGDSGQESSGSQNAGNANDQDFARNAGSQTNAPRLGLDQDAGNEANAGDGAAGGDADNEGSANFNNQVVDVLVRILDSILSGGDTIIIGGEDEDDDSENDNGPALPAGCEFVVGSTTAVVCTFSLLDPPAGCTTNLLAGTATCTLVDQSVLACEGATEVGFPNLEYSCTIL